MGVGLVAAGALPWLAMATPAAAAEDEYAATTWNFTPANGSGVTCTLFAESRVTDTVDGRIALLHYQLRDEDPGCEPFLVQLDLDYTDVHGNRQRADSSGQNGPTELWLRAYNVADDGEVSGDVFVGYDGCAVPRDCLTFRTLQPK